MLFSMLPTSAAHYTGRLYSAQPVPLPAGKSISAAADNRLNSGQFLRRESMGYHIYGIGNALVDKEFEVSDAFFSTAGIQKGVMTLIDANQQEQLLQQLLHSHPLKKRACGGSAANTIIGASYFGAKTFYTCNVANDEAGDFYVNDLKAAGVDTNMDGARDEGVTGKCLVMVTPDAERTMNTYLGITSDLHEKHIHEDALAQSECVYIDGYLVTS